MAVGTSALERDAELGVLRRRLGEAVGGSGSTVVVSGGAGMGRSFLIDQVRRQARDAGWTVLEARCAPTSARLDYGVVRDWFDSLALRAEPDVPPFDGPARSVVALARGEQVELGELVYGVRRALDHLAERAPLLLVADDLQWADARSTEVLELLVATITQLPCVLVVGVRSGEPTQSAAAEPLRRLVATAEELRLHAWSRQAVRERVRIARREQAVDRAVRLAGARHQQPGPAATPPLPATPVSRESEQADLLMRRTGGVPFLVEQLLAAEAGPEAPVGAALVTSVAERLSRLGESATTTARVIGLLAGYADLTSVAEVTGAAVPDVADDVSVLLEAQILVREDSALRLRQPVVGEALVSMLSAAESSRLHRAVADVLARRGADRGVVARRLLATVPSDDQAVRARLQEQGDHWLTVGRPDFATGYYERALAEGPVTESQVDLLAALAGAQAATGRLDEALATWSRARDLTTDPVVEGHLRAKAGDALMAAGRSREAEGARTPPDAPDDATSSTQRRHARMALAGLLTGVSTDFLHQQVATALAHPPQGRTPEERLSLAAAAAVTTFEARDAHLAREMTLRAVTQGDSTDDSSEAGLLFLSAGVLLWTSTYVEAEALLTTAITDAMAQGSHHRLATASVCRGLIRVRMGLVTQAQRDLEIALAERDRGWSAYLAPLLAGLVECRIARGEIEVALEVRGDLDELTHAPGVAGSFATYALAELAAASSDPDLAAQLYAQVGRLVEGRMDNPAVLPWRAGEALARIRLAQPRAAVHLARENLRLAEAFGAPYAIAEALRTLAAVDASVDRVRLLRRALRTLRGVSAARLEAQVATDLAGMLVLTGQLEDHGEPSVLLRRAESYAAYQELRPLADRVGRLLHRLGEPVRRTASESIELLTPSELRVAELAAAGMSNRAIAQQLFVTVKAVEWHLSNTYRKLGIRSRNRLPAIMDAVGR